MKVKCGADPDQHWDAEPPPVLEHPSLLLRGAKTNPYDVGSRALDDRNNFAIFLWCQQEKRRATSEGTSCSFSVSPTTSMPACPECVGSHLTGAGSGPCSFLLTGFTEKNLCRHGSHRSARIRSTRQNIAIIPGTCSAAIRCNSKLPQIPQCA